MRESETRIRKQIVRDAYNRCAKDYAAARDHFHNQQWLDELLASLPAGALVLDAGCGAGVPVAEYLLEHGCRVIGVDIAEEQVAAAPNVTGS